jgi:DNA-binding transcriptional LysR family regulator
VGRRKVQRYLRSGLLPQLRVFEAVVRHGSFTRAAAELHIAQPTASLHIKKLTETVEAPLVELVGNRVQPTAAGLALKTASDEIVAALARFEEALAGLRDLSSGSLKIAAATTEKYIVPRLLAEFVRRHPDIEASVQVLPCAALLARVAEGDDDLYFLSLPPEREDIVVHPVLPNPFVVLARSDHPLAGAKSTPFARFAQEPLIVRELGSVTRAVTKRAFAAHGLEPAIRMELGCNDAIKEAVLAGLGVAVLARYSIGFSLDPRALAVLDVEGFPIESHWHIAYPAGKRLSPIARAFVAMVQGEAKSLLVAAPVPSETPVYPPCR